MIYIDDIEKATLENTDYRRVVFTGKHSQLVLMSIPVNEEIDMEVHLETDQFFRFESGEGEITVENKKYAVRDGSGVIIPAGKYHRVRNVGRVPLKLYSIYSPAHHPKGLIQKDKPNKLFEALLLMM